METILLEIGSEEIPAGYIQPALDALSTNLLKKLDDARVDHGPASCYGTPRRLAVMIADVAPKQKSLTTEVIGPPERVGFDASGKPTVAAEKFSEKIGIPVSKVRVVETEKGRYLAARVTERGQATRNLLKKILPEVVQATPFPKRMRWADLSMEFARPIHSILALYGKQVVSLVLENIKSGRTTRGHYFMNPGRIKIDHPDRYVAALRDADVIVDIDERRSMTEREITAVARQAGGRILEDAELLDIVTNLVEFPVPVVGRFETKFLELPSEILITAMREHQKYFATVDDDGRLLSSFIAVNNTRTRDMDLVASGHERVIRARLEDARFFYHADVKASFDDWVEALNGVLFQAQLGSMYEKTQRVRTIAEYVADTAMLAETVKSDASRAALLCKADLVTEVVGEFPKLQGVMGRVYAEVKGEAAPVARAIEEHYRPLRSGGELPTEPTGAIVAIADKIDSICGCFSVGLVPTGAADPYALRRQGIGIIQIMLDRRFGFSLRALIQRALDLFGDRMTEPLETTAEKVMTFLQNRMAHLLSEDGHAKDVIAAVTAVSADRVPDVWNRVRALDALRKAPDFEPLAAAFKRVGNIIRQADMSGVGEVVPGAFQHDSETALMSAFETASASVADRLENGRIDEALRDVAALRGPVDAFFEDVMVMVDDPAIRNNRLALLQAVSTLFSRFADFSKLSI